MKEYNADCIRSIALLGHGGAGKTSLMEAAVYDCGGSDRIGRVEDGNTISDYDQEERKRKISIYDSVSPCEFNDHKIYIVDTPGYFDFVGEVIEALRAVDSAVIVTSGVSGAQVGTEKAWDSLNKLKMPRAFFINKLDRENSNFEKAFNSLKSKFGSSVVPLHLPIGKEENFKGIINLVTRKAYIYDAKSKSMKECDTPKELEDKVEEYRGIIMEAVAETDEVLLEKYLSDGEISNDEVIEGLRKGILACEIAPVFCGSSTGNIAITNFLKGIIYNMPSPVDMGKALGKNAKSDEECAREPKKDEPFSAFVFKTIADPFVGRLSLFRVKSGTVSSDTSIYNSSRDKTEKIGTLYVLKGKQQMPVKKLYAGDIGAVSKLQFTMTGDTLSDSSKPIVYPPFEFPKPCITMVVTPKAKGDEDKISSGLHRLLEEDPTFSMGRDVENAQTTVSGQGELHIQVIVSKLKNKFGADTNIDFPKIPYRETIRKAADVQGKYKKQSGGHGQYGDVVIKFEPQYETEELVFCDEIVGGVVPRQYIPAVEKGLRDSIKKGVLAGYPVINLKARLHYGSYHSVDSSEMAFKTAASMAFKKGMKEANPVLLEPIMHMEITVPDVYMGDIMGDMTRRRGRVIGSESLGGMQRITAEVPMAEVFKYATDLRSMTQARGSFDMRFERYEQVPDAVVSKIVEAAHMQEGNAE